MFKKRNPRDGFVKYSSSILERPENRIVFKTNPHTRFSKISHNGEYVHYGLDEDVFPVVTHHLSVSAIQDVHEYKDTKRLKFDIQDVLRYLDDVNTNDEGANYKYIVDRLKLIIVNLSNTFGIPI